MNTIYARCSQKPVRPRLHPVVQIYGAEWTNAPLEGRPLSWDGLTTQAITQACKQQRNNDAMKSWPSDLSADDISNYLGEVGANYIWCGDSLLSVVESPVIHEEQVGRRRIAGIDVGGGGKLGPRLGQCRCGANLW